MLDGLDEVADPLQRQQISEWVDVQMQRYPKTAFIMTSRPFGYYNAELKEVRTRLEVQPFNLKQIDNFLRHWYLQNSEISKLKAKRNLFIARVRFLEVSGALLTHQYGFSSIPNSVFQKLEQDLSRLVSQANPSKNIYDTVYDIDAELEAIKKRMNDS